MPGPERCYCCQQQSSTCLVCQNCRPASALKHVWAATTYNQWAKQLVHKLKFERAQGAAEIMAGLIADTLPYLENPIIVHVPTATSRIRQRGYDQAALIARALARQLKAPYAPLLARLGQTRQVGVARKQRQQQLQGAFWIKHPEPVKGAHILLIDDVLTTGSTFEAAARLLRQAGAETVDAAAFAQRV